MNLNGYGVDKVREHNLKLIIYCLYEKPQSCKELSIISGLSETAIKKNIVQLLNNNLVKIYDEEIADKSIGRQHIRYTINEDYGEFLLVDLSHDSNVFYVTDLVGNIFYKNKINLSTRFGMNELSNFCKEVKTLCDDKKFNIKEIAVSIPGQINEETGELNYSSRFDKREISNLKNIFQEYFVNSYIYIKNDIRFSTYGDPLLLKRSSNTIVTYIQVGYGIVGAFVKDGKIIQGFNSISGEIGVSKIGQETLHDLCAISSLIHKTQKITKCDSIDELIELFNTNNKVKEIILDSASIMGRVVESISNALGSNIIIFMGEVTKLGNEYLETMQKILDEQKDYNRIVEFVDYTNYRFDGMQKILRDKLINCVK